MEAGPTQEAPPRGEHEAMRTSDHLPCPTEDEHTRAAPDDARPFTLPPALLRELTRPIAGGDVERLLAQLDCARARGCF
jgi:hypothetical protein